MQITLNQSEVIKALENHIAGVVADLDVDITDITVNEDGTALIVIGEEVVSEDNPPVVEQKRRKRRNAAEAKHVPVEAKEALKGNETQTSTGGVSENSTQEAEQATEVGDKTEPTQELKEEATQQAEDSEAETATEQAAVEEKVQEKVEAEKPATAKPSLFAGLKR